MKNLVLFLTVFATLSSCAEPPKKPRVEAGDLLYITDKTAKNMDNCISRMDKSACIEADKLLKKYPWLKTKEFKITNDKGVKIEDFQVQANAIKSNFNYIKTYYQTFYWVNENR